VGVGADNDRRCDGPEPGNVLQAGSELFSELVQLAMVDLEQLGLLQDGDRETASLATGNDPGIGRSGAASAPGRDGADLRVGQRLEGIDAKVDATQQRGERVAVRGALLVDDRACGEQHAQGSARPALAGPGNGVVVAADHRTGSCFGVKGVGLGRRARGSSGRLAGPRRRRTPAPAEQP